MTESPPEIVLRIATALALVQFPHKDWNLHNDEVKGFYIKDANEILDALHYAGYTLTRKEQ